MSVYETWEESTRKALAAREADLDMQNGVAAVKPSAFQSCLVPRREPSTAAKSRCTTGPRVDWVLGFLTIWLWIVFTLANLFMAFVIFAAFYVGIGGDPPLTTAIGFLVASGGFLGIIHAVRAGARSIVEAITAERLKDEG